MVDFSRETLREQPINRRAHFCHVIIYPSHDILLGDFEERTVGQSKHTATQTKLIQPDMFARNNVNKSTKSVATQPCTRSCPGSTSHPQPHIRAAIELFTTMAVYLHSIHTHMAHTHYIITPFGIIPYFVEYNK